jgi:hypothetical protein
MGTILIKTEGDTYLRTVGYQDILLDTLRSIQEAKSKVC